MKTCAKCGAEKDESFFGKCKRSPDGLRPRCKICRSEDDKKYADSQKEYEREYYLKNKEKHNAGCRERYQKNKERYKKAQKAWAESNRKSTLNSKRKYNKVHIDRVREGNKNRKRHCIKNILTPYVKSCLKKHGYTSEQIEQFPELLDVKKLQIIVKRLGKQIKNKKNEKSKN